MLYEVCFTSAVTGNQERSRIFQTIKAARKWAKWVAAQSYVAAVQIYKGGAGGELVK